MFLFRLKRTLKLGIKSLWMHRLRSTLTALGIIFGVSSVIAMLAIGEGASEETQKQIAQLGSLNIILETVKPQSLQSSTGQQQQLIEYGLTYDDADRLRKGIKDVLVVVPNRKISDEGIYKHRRTNIEVIGTMPWQPEISPINIEFGRFLTEIDIQYKKGVCVIDDKVRRDLFVIDNPLGQDLKIGSDWYRVVGIVSELSTQKKSSGGFGKTDTGKKDEAASFGKVYIPLSTAQNRFGDTQIQMSGGSRMMEKVELEQIIIKADILERVMNISQSVKAIINKYHKDEDYKMSVPLELMRQAKNTQRIFTIVLGSIAAISLIVGGIGIMNIMLATVSERTREIGIRRALGAKKKDIIFQFLSETFILTAAGGILGILLGLGIPSVVEHYGHQPTIVKPLSLLLAFGISSSVGIIFGLYPAYRAANMDPIESLRHE